MVLLFTLELVDCGGACRGRCVFGGWGAQVVGTMGWFPHRGMGGHAEVSSDAEGQDWGVWSSCCSAPALHSGVWGGHPAEPPRGDMAQGRGWFNDGALWDLPSKKFPLSSTWSLCRW